MIRRCWTGPYEGRVAMPDAEDEPTEPSSGPGWPIAETVSSCSCPERRIDDRLVTTHDHDGNAVVVGVSGGAVGGATRQAA